MSPPGKQSLVFPVALLLMLSLCMQEVVAASAIQADQSIATAGYFRLTWQTNPTSTDQESEFVVQQSRTQGFEQVRNLYQGTEKASLISGMPDGVYFYRVKEKDASGWSVPVRVQVQHHPLGTALQFFGLGLLVFALTLFTILHGIRKTRS